VRKGKAPVERERGFSSHASLLYEKEMKHMDFEKKKEDIPSKYMSEDFKEEHNKAKEMLNIQQ
jgi:hypothetical protein